MRFYIFTLAFCLMAWIALPNSADAACSNPAGEEGEMVYNQDHKMMQFCDGTDWIAMGGISPGAGSGGGGCSWGRIFAKVSSAYEYPDCGANAVALGCFKRDDTSGGNEQRSGIFTNARAITSGCGPALGFYYDNFSGTYYQNSNHRSYIDARLDGAQIATRQYLNRYCSSTCGTNTYYNVGMCICQEVY